MDNKQQFDATRLRRVVALLGLASAVPDDDAELLDCLGSVLGMVARKIEEQQSVIQRQALANLTLLAEAAGARKPDNAPAAHVPCPVCGGEAAGHLDAMRRAYFIPASLVAPGCLHEPDPESGIQIRQDGAYMKCRRCGEFFGPGKLVGVAGGGGGGSGRTSSTRFEISGGCVINGKSGGTI